nr:hypothetical protein [Actinomycetales bacterium]
MSENTEQPEPQRGITAEGPVEVRHRRAPRYGRFIAFGLLLAGVVTFVVAILTRGWSALALSDSFWLLLLSLGPLGMLLGALVAFISDRRSIARMERQRPAAPEAPEA